MRPGPSIVNRQNAHIPNGLTSLARIGRFPGARRDCTIPRATDMNRNPAVAPPLNAARRHVRFGWWSLLVFAALGLTLEVFHGFKVAAYLDVSNETRRLMWRLAHAHGVLLGLIHVVYGLALGAMPGLGGPNAGFVTTALIGASLLLPGGFFLGGVAFYGGDPGLGIALVPVGALMLLAALFLIARSTPRA